MNNKLYFWIPALLAGCSGAATNPFPQFDGSVETDTSIHAQDDARRDSSNAPTEVVFERLVDNRFGAFRDAWASSSSDIHFIAYNGSRTQFLKYNGTTLDSLAGANTEFTGIWGIASDDVWAVGPDGNYAIYRGTSWETPASNQAPTNGDMHATWGSGVGRWAVGYNFGSNGVASTYGSGRDVWTTSGDVGNVPRRNGQENWRAVGGFGMHTFISGEDATYHWNGSTWSSFGDLGAIDMFSGNGFVAFTSTLRAGIIVPNTMPSSFNPDPFVAIELDLPPGVPNYSLRRVWASDLEFWIGGTNGLLYRRTQNGWQRVNLNTTEEITMILAVGSAMWVGTTGGLYVGRQR